MLGIVAGGSGTVFSKRQKGWSLGCLALADGYLSNQSSTSNPVEAEADGQGCACSLGGFGGGGQSGQSRIRNDTISKVIC